MTLGLANANTEAAALGLTIKIAVIFLVGATRGMVNEITKHSKND
jgi:hypothetical protein